MEEEVYEDGFGIMVCGLERGLVLGYVYFILGFVIIRGSDC